jgi:hypothetical protein
MSRGASVSSRADGSIALLGSLSATRLGATFRAAWRSVNHGPTGLTFVLAYGRGDSIDIEIMGPPDSLSEFVKILDDGVSALHDGFLAGSSSGVQMIGGLRPSERQTASIVPRIVAFARCLQFHVSRYVTWWAAATPMWNASTVAFSGKAPCRTNSLRARQPSCRVRERENGDASQRSQSTHSRQLIASRGLVENELRDAQLIR